MPCCLPKAFGCNRQVCHARNIHGRSAADIKAAARALERIPSLYPQLDASGLLQKGPPEQKQACLLAFLVLHSQTRSIMLAPFPSSLPSC